ncbi:phosphate/phosphite/phosphonate ABC transporter substrate-binding protein [Bdellovibrio bacteriovorus]|uniref:phosphate/phosphite/phosphonate ABC transporter substrate-binding protein n=1 Tax=Bdellovibrio bacteriovorus TaxID=959 RepID=UPI0021D33600|nr:phosphate/phosphite/phosphonate ABC transporter substrate-binding protein [Bdellovibrio bacteriovorus]UXR65463.1 phosphate/phosphite/phosphonate ABC transporter substrate-binding protein [Bdellovibrio bacteriovorus]
MLKKVLVIACSAFMITCTSQKELGSSDKPVRLALVPGQDSAVLMENGKILEKWILQQSGVHVRVQVPVSFVAVVEAMGSERVDVAILNPFGYILAHEKYGATARLMGVNGEYSEYWGQIITANPKIKNLQDLKGKKFAFVDPVSTSGYVLAAKLLQDEKIKLGETIFAGKHDSVVTMVYQGRVDAGATYNTPAENGVPQDARRLVTMQFPDVYEKVRILAKTGPIPSEPVVYRKNFPPELEKKISQALKSFSSTPEGGKALKKLYHLTGFKDCSDKDYDSARQMLLDLGQKVQDLVK